MPFELSVPRAAAFAAIVLVGMGLSACTTTEGTNAFASPQTFETEVMDKTAQGLGLIPTPVKPDPTNLRGPLVLPKDTKDLPPPQTADAETAALPVDDTKPKIDTTGLSAADIEHAKHARVVDINTPDGRPLTAAELKTLTAKMKSFTLSSKRSIFTPPEQYFSLDNNQQDLVCLSKTGDLVSVNDPSCPVEIRNALLKKKS
ncbi:MAG TPA: hypothetical protein VN109_10080 [Devosia sp.]|jgi:hypothetical protein|nr:hypothetical protein [Devosia sp.]